MIRADLVNVLLLQRGYDVVIAPEKLREQITSFEGISQWTLKIHKHRGNIRHLFGGENPCQTRKGTLYRIFCRTISPCRKENPEYWRRSRDYPQ